MAEEDQSPGVRFGLGWGPEILRVLEADARTSLRSSGLRFRLGAETRFHCCEHRHLHVTLAADLPLAIIQTLLTACYVWALALDRANWDPRAGFGVVLWSAHSDAIAVVEQTDPQIAQQVVGSVVVVAMINAINEAIAEGKPLLILAAPAGAIPVPEPDSTLN